MVGDVEGFMDELRRAGDPSADAVIGELARTQQIRAVSRVLRHLVDNDQPVPDELPSSIARWLQETAELPGWVDPDRFERGCTLVVEHGPQVCVVLATGVARVLLRRLSRRQGADLQPPPGPRRRAPRGRDGAVRPVGDGAGVALRRADAAIRKIQKVRLLHAAIRHLVTASRPLGCGRRRHPDLPGGPGRHADVVLARIVVDSLRRLGVRVEDREAEDYYYRWRVIGEMLGIDPAAIPVDLAGARELTDLIARRNHRRSRRGDRDDPRAVRPACELAAAGLRRGRAGAHAIPDGRRDVRRWSTCPRTRWDRKISWQAGMGRALDRAQSARGPIGSLTKLVGAGMLNQRVAEMAGGRSASFSIPVPHELERSWTASGVFPRASTPS